MDRATQDARQVGGRVRGRLDTPSGLGGPPRANKRQQTTPDESLYCLYARFQEPREFATDLAPCYLLGVSNRRVRVLVLSRSGRYIHTWQPRQRLGPFSLAKVTQDNIAYGFLQAYLGKPDRKPTTVYSLTLAEKFRDMLGEDIQHRALQEI